MISKRLAENYVADAASILDEAKSARDKGLYHRAIRRSQETFELALKAILRSAGIEYPKEHEVSDALRDNITKFPNWVGVKVPYLEAGSAWLSERRGASMYGDEISGKPASQLFTPHRLSNRNPIRPRSSRDREKTAPRIVRSEMSRRTLSTTRLLIHN